MRIALIGNMNNNNFSIMRYFRDLGADAHLLLWDNDGKGSLSHFVPESDTWDIGPWSKYIHQTELANAFSSIIPDPRKFKLAPSVSKIKAVFDDFDVLIGSGIAPALMDRVNRSLDIFYPYSTGVEFVGIAPNGKSIESETWFRQRMIRYIRAKQITGIKRSRYCLNAELGPTQDTLNMIGRETLPLAIPMIYNREEVKNEMISERLLEIAKKLELYDLKVFSHGRQLWKEDAGYTKDDWQGMNKNNDWLIYGFFNFLKQNKKINSVLVILEYGPNLRETKALCSELGIDDNVVWLPVMPRKEIMYLLSKCDIGVGEFTVFPGCLWGGTGWEVLASGKPLLQTFNFSKEEFIAAFGHEPPAILDVRSPEDVTRHFVDWCKNKEKYIKMGIDAKEWFNTHNGIGLAMRWLDLLKAPKTKNFR